jgi:two-component system, NarL family, nitrate/nitrite response regulator NarL
VVLADDHQSMIAKVRGTLGAEFEIVGTAEKGGEALSSVLSLDADILIIDISMPVLNGLQVAQHFNGSASAASAQRAMRKRLWNLGKTCG